MILTLEEWQKVTYDYMRTKSQEIVKIDELYYEGYSPYEAVQFFLKYKRLFLES